MECQCDSPFWWYVAVVESVAAGLAVSVACGLARYWKTQAEVDALTGLLNRRAFWDKVEKDLAKKDEPCCLLFVDLDDFKAVNDRYGHAVGDEVLKTTADICSRIVRRQDSICRFGGEEFVVYLPQTQLSQARQIAERIRRGIESSSAVVGVTSSIGISVCDVTDRLADLLDQADCALYKAKKKGKNCVVHVGSNKHS